MNFWEIYRIFRFKNLKTCPKLLNIMPFTNLFYFQVSLNPVRVLKNDADEEKAETARLSSFVGAMAIGDLVKSTLGPKGMKSQLGFRLTHSIGVFHKAVDKKHSWNLEVQMKGPNEKKSMYVFLFTVTPGFEKLSSALIQPVYLIKT